MKYDAKAQTYTISASGEKHVVPEGRFLLRLEKSLGRCFHRRGYLFPGRRQESASQSGVLMVRQSLNADSPYVDIALHGVRNDRSPVPQLDRVT